MRYPRRTSHLLALILPLFARLCLARDQAAAARGFVVRQNLTVTAPAAAGQAARLTVTPRDGTAGVVVELSRGAVALFAGPTTSLRRLWRQRLDLTVGAHTLLVRQRPTGLSLYLDQQRLTVQPCRLPDEIVAAFEPAPAVAAADRLRTQRLESIRFADDFARVGEGGELWESKGGCFVVKASLTPDSSQGAFQLWASAADRRALSLATGSYWFWDDYRAGVSVRAEQLPATFGLVFHYVDVRTYHVLEWRQPRRGQGQVSVLRFRGGRQEVLSRVPCSLQPRDWNRLTVATLEDQARAYVNGAEVGRVVDPGLAGGRLGLWLERSAAVLFDDLTVESLDPGAGVRAWDLAWPFGPCEQEWSDYSGKHFSADRFMADWAQPQSFWAQASATQPGLWWFRTRFFHDVSCRWERPAPAVNTWPPQPLRLLLFGDRDNAERGYAFALDKSKLTLTRNGTPVSEAALAESATLESLAVTAAPEGVSALVNGREVLDWHDPEPLAEGEVAADLGPIHGRGAGDWRHSTTVVSSHRLDYTFEGAPAAWAVQSGTWQGTHRWACIPCWSFFGGRGLPGAAGVPNGNAALWSRRRFRGDFDLELFLAPMEGTPQFVHFAWPVTANVAFAADGQHLDSGYMLLFGTYDLPSRLYRQGRQVAAWESRVNPALRGQPMTWYHRLSQVWQHLRIQRRGSHVRIDIGRHDDEGNSLGLEPAFDFEDPDAILDGDRIGVWTWGANGLALARATISYAASPGPAPLATPEPGRVSAGTSTETRSGPPPGPAVYQRTTNLDSGGLFSHDLIREPIDLERTGTLEFDGRFPPGLALSLFADVRGQRAEVVVCGPDAYRPFTVPLGRLFAGPTRPDGRWRRARLDLLAALRRVYPHGRLVAERLVLASPYHTVEQIAGLGVNRAGAFYDLSNVRWLPSPPLADRPPPPALDVRVNGVRLLDDFESGLGDWTRLGGWDGAALYRDPQDARSGHASLRLLNQFMGGPAGAWITQTPYDLSRFPVLAFDYRFPPDVEVNLLVRANQQWFEVQATGRDATWPVVGRLADFRADSAWHHAGFDLYATLAARLGRPDITVQALAWADSLVMATPQDTAYWLDNFSRAPAIDPASPTVFELTWGEPGAVTAYSHVIDGAPDTEPPATATGSGNQLTLSGPIAGQYLHLRACNRAGEWSTTQHLPIVAGKHAAPTPPAAAAPAPAPAPDAPPAVPRVAYVPSDRLCWNDFDWEQSPENPEQRMGEFSIRREAWVLRCTDDGATDQGCVSLVNLDATGFYSAYFRKSAWDPARWPRIAFDYKFEQPGCALNLSLLVDEAMTVVEWTGPNYPGGYFADAGIGRTDVARQDGEWHHVEFDLFDMLAKTRYRDPDRPRLTVTELATWATAHHGGYTYYNPLGCRVKIDNFIIFNPRGRDPAFAWRVDPTPAAGLAGYAHCLDQTPDTLPPERVTTSEAKADFHDVAPGTWFFHVRACDRQGRWGQPAHCRIEIQP